MTPYPPPAEAMLPWLKRPEQKRPKPEKPKPAPEAPARNLKLRCIAVLLEIAVLILVIGSMLAPWYHTGSREGWNEGSLSNSQDTMYYFNGVYFSDARTGTAIYSSWEETQFPEESSQLFSYTETMELIALVLASAIVATSVLYLKFGKRQMTLLLSAATVVWLLFVPLLFMQHYPTSPPYNEFALTYHVTDYEMGAPSYGRQMTYTCAPAVGWYLPFIASILCIIQMAIVYAERPRPVLRGLRVPFALVSAATVVLSGAAFALYPSPPEPIDGIGPLYLWVDALDDGNWRIWVISGSFPADGTTIQTYDNYARTVRFAANIDAGEHFNQQNFVWDDNNDNDRLDVGDYILLYGVVGGHPNLNVQAGYSVYIMHVDSVYATIRELPAR